MTAFLITALFLLLAVLGTPLFVLMGALALWLFHGAGINISSVVIEMLRLAEMPNLIAIPLFTFAGYLLAESKSPKRLLDLAEAMCGWMPGGLAIVGLLAAALFTAFTGASGVTIVALGGLLYPMLIQRGYSKKFTLGLITCTGSLGLLFPPSLPIILYGLVAKVSIDQLFLAGAVPAVLLIAALACYGVWVDRRSNLPRQRFSTTALLRAARAAAWEFPIPIGVLGGIYGGLFTATDAAAVMAFYVLVVEVLIHRDIKLTELPGVVRRSMLLVGAILMVLATALGLTNYLIDAQIPDRLFQSLHSWIPSKTVFLLVLNALLLIVNMVELLSAIIIVVPIILPVAMQYEIDPIHLGVIFLLNLEIGYMTPPLGLNLFLSNRRFDEPLPRLYRATFVFWLIHVAVLLLITYLPQLSLFMLRGR